MAKPVQIPIGNWALRLVAWVFAFTAVVLSALAVASCRFMKVSTMTPAANGGNPTTNVSFTGIFQFFASGGCVSLSLLLDIQDPNDENRVELSGSHKAAQAFGVLTPVVGGIIMLQLLAQFICRQGKCTRVFSSVVMFLCVVFQGLTFIIFNDDNCKSETVVDENGNEARTARKCTVDTGAKEAIAAMAMFLLAGLLICKIPSPETPLFKISFDSMESEQIPSADTDEPTVEPTNYEKRTVTESINPDGTKTTFITTTVKNDAELEAEV